MKPPAFDYVAPRALDEVLDALEKYGDEAKLLAGGQSLVPAMNFRVMQPSVLIDLNRVPALEYIRENDRGGLSIGAMTRHRSLEKSDLAKQVVPLLHEAVPSIAHPQIRNRGTIGGSLIHADPAAEFPVLALALNAKFNLLSKEGNRWVDAAEFFWGMFMTDIAENEILIEIEIPGQMEGAGWSFLELSRRRGDYAMMGVAALLNLDEEGKIDFARLVYLNAGDGPVDAVEATEGLLGNKPTEEVFSAAAVQAAENEIDPMGNVHASISYQRHLANVLTRRALNIAVRRAKFYERDPK